LAIVGFAGVTAIDCSVGPVTVRLMVAVCELPPSVAVTTALWLLGILAAAVALKVAVVAPAGTVTDASPFSAMAVVAVSVLLVLYVKSAMTEPFVWVPYSDVPGNPAWLPSVHVGVLPVPAV
jgi:hypothetical protein